MTMIEIPLKSAEINGNRQTILLPVEDVMAALVRKYAEESNGNAKKNDRA